MNGEHSFCFPQAFVPKVEDETIYALLRYFMERKGVDPKRVGRILEYVESCDSRNDVDRSAWFMIFDELIPSFRSLLREAKKSFYEIELRLLKVVLFAYLCEKTTKYPVEAMLQNALVSAASDSVQDFFCLCSDLDDWKKTDLVAKTVVSTNDIALFNTLLEINWPLSVEVYELASRMERFEFIHKIVHNKLPVSEKLIITDLEVLNCVECWKSYITNNKQRRIPREVFVRWAKHKNMKMLTELEELNPPRDVCEIIVQNGDVETMTTLIAAGYPLEESFLEDAIVKKDKDMIGFLLDNGCPLPESSKLTSMVFNFAYEYLHIFLAKTDSIRYSSKELQFLIARNDFVEFQRILASGGSNLIDGACAFIAASHGRLIFLRRILEIAFEQKKVMHKGIVDVAMKNKEYECCEELLRYPFWYQSKSSDTWVISSLITSFPPLENSKNIDCFKSCLVTALDNHFGISYSSVVFLVKHVAKEPLSTLEIWSDSYIEMSAKEFLERKKGVFAVKNEDDGDQQCRRVGKGNLFSSSSSAISQRELKFVRNQAKKIRHYLVRSNSSSVFAPGDAGC